MLAISTTPQKYEQPGLTIQAARNSLTNTTLNYERSQVCLYQKQTIKTTLLYPCHLKVGAKFTGPANQNCLKPQSTNVRGIAMNNNKNNIVELHPTNTPRDFESENRFETPFLKASKPDYSPLNIPVSGELAYMLRCHAIEFGNTPQTSAVHGLTAWLSMNGGGAHD